MPTSGDVKSGDFFHLVPLLAVLAVSGSFAYYACALHVLGVWLGLAFCVLALGCFQVCPRPPLPTQSFIVLYRPQSFIVFPLNSLFSVTGA